MRRENSPEPVTSGPEFIMFRRSHYYQLISNSSCHERTKPNHKSATLLAINIPCAVVRLKSTTKVYCTSANTPILCITVSALTWWLFLSVGRFPRHVQINYASSNCHGWFFPLQFDVLYVYTVCICCFSALLISDWEGEYGGLKAGRRMMSLGTAAFHTLLTFILNVKALFELGPAVWVY
jgi:hypothetical protein